MSRLITGLEDRWKGMSRDFERLGWYTDMLNSTAEHPVQVIPGGVHCYDLILENGVVNEGVQTVIDNEIAQIKKWVEEYYSQ